MKEYTKKDRKAERQGEKRRKGDVESGRIKSIRKEEKNRWKKKRRNKQRKERKVGRKKERKRGVRKGRQRRRMNIERQMKSSKGREEMKD